MTNPTTGGFKSQLSAEWQKTKKTRDYDKIKSLHVDINAAKNKVKTMIAEKKAGETIVLSGSGASLLAYDLDGVDWLTPGRLYQCKDVVYCLENSNTQGVTLV